MVDRRGSECMSKHADRHEGGDEYSGRWWSVQEGWRSCGGHETTPTT